MSFTFTEDGLKMQKLLNNENWNILFRMFHQFCYHRGYSANTYDINSKQNKYLELFELLVDGFYSNKILMNCKNDCKFWQGYLIDFLQNNNILLTELDLQAIKSTRTYLESR